MKWLGLQLDNFVNYNNTLPIVVGTLAAALVAYLGFTIIQFVWQSFKKEA
jgi:hypothetical protein